MRIDATPCHRNDPGCERRTGRLILASGLALFIAGSIGLAAQAQESVRAADDLMRLVPPDASLVITVEGLREQVRTIGGSRLVAELRQLPAVREWFESEKYRHLEKSCADVEAALGVKLPEIRDQILGDAVVLVLRLPPDGPPDPSRARGLLLLRARDPVLLARLVSTFNKVQRQSGELKGEGDRRHGTTNYKVREFPEGSGRPPEWYVGYPDGTFAFSNSEELIQAVIDRKPEGPSVPISGAPAGFKEKAKAPIPPGLGQSPRLIAVRRRLPERPMARLYLDPRAVERLLGAASQPAKPDDARFLTLIRRHLAAVDYAGAALTWQPDAVIIRAVETLDASRADGWLRRWAGDSRPVRPSLCRVPRTAVALASAHVEWTALREAIEQVVPEAEHQRLRNLEALLTGLMLGQEFASRILPALGPGLIAYLDAPAEPPSGEAGGDGPPRGRGGLFPMVIVADISGGASDPNPGPPAVPNGIPGVAVADAIENALRTFMTLMALDEKRGQGRASVVSSATAGASVTTLSVPIPFAFAVDRAGGRLVLGTSASSVARYLESTSDPEAGARFSDWRAAAFPGFETFVCVDLEALTRIAGRYQHRIARNLAARQNRPAADVERDLEHVLGLASLFRTAFVASRIEPDASAIHRALGVVTRDAPAVSGSHR